MEIKYTRVRAKNFLLYRSISFLAYAPKIVKSQQSKSGLQISNTQIITIPNIKDQVAWFITGVAQSDGSFSLSVILNKEKTKIQNLRLKFSIEMTKESLPLLKKIKQSLACGNILIRDDRNMVNYSVESLSELWHNVIPHFLNYPLIGSKNYSFYKFFQVLTILYPLRGKSKDKLTLAKAVITGWNMNSKEEIIEELNSETVELKRSKHNNLKRTKKNLNFLLNLIDPANTTTTSQEIEKEIKFPLIDSWYHNSQYSLFSLNIYYILGIIEGDGSFYVGLRQNKTSPVRFGFNITTHLGDLSLLYAIKFRLCCGNVKIKGDTWCRFETEGQKDLRNVLIRLVESGPNEGKLLGAKSLNYEIFKKVMCLFVNKKHLQKEGLEEIVKTIYSGSDYKNRKLSLEDYLKSLNK